MCIYVVYVIAWVQVSMYLPPAHQWDMVSARVQFDQLDLVVFLQLSFAANCDADRYEKNLKTYANYLSFLGLFALALSSSYRSVCFVPNSLPMLGLLVAEGTVCGCPFRG